MLVDTNVGLATVKKTSRKYTVIIDFQIVNYADRLVMTGENI